MEIPSNLTNQELYLTPTFNPPPRKLSNMDLLKLLIRIGTTLEEREGIFRPSTKKSAVIRHTEEELKSLSKPKPAPESSSSIIDVFEGSLSYNSTAENANKTAEVVHTGLSIQKSLNKPPVNLKVPNNIQSKPGQGLFAQLNENTKRNRESLNEGPNKKLKPIEGKSNAFLHLLDNSTKSSRDKSNPQQPLHSGNQSIGVPSAAVRATLSSSLQNSSTQEKRATTSAQVSSGKQNTFSSDDFTGIQFVCKNLATVKSLEMIQRTWGDGNGAVQISFVFRDMSTNHSPTTLKYCRSSANCDLWYCTCDKTIRTAKLRNKSGIVGTLLIFGDLNQSYFLPLTDSESEEKILPFRCEASIHKRLQFFFDLLTSNLRKTLYHSQISFIACFDLFQKYSFPIPLVQNIFDPTIATFLLNSDITEENLELYNLFSVCKMSIPTKETFFLQQRNDNKQYPENHYLEMGKFAKALLKLFNEGILILDLCIKSERSLEESNHQSLSLANLMKTIEMPANCVLSLMEFYGIHVDVVRIKQTHQRLQKQIQETEERCFRLSGFQFNLSSPEQVSKVLFNKLQILNLSPANTDGNAKPAAPINIAKGSKGYLSTSEADLLKVAHLHPVVNEILQYRSLTKLQSAYIHGLIPLIVELPTRRKNEFPSIHAYWNQANVRTGRLSCAKPNLQNIPSNQLIGGEDYSIREFFCPSEGFVLFAADYSQIEVRVLAHCCGDPIMYELFQNDQDIYRQLAGKILNIPTDQVPDDERNKAKTVCLGLLYGMGVKLCAQKLNLSIPQAQKIITSFFNTFKYVNRWIENTKNQARHQKFVKTLKGRTRHLLDINSTDREKSSAAERQAVNTIIQGTASDLIKFAMIQMNNLILSLSNYFYLKNSNTKLSAENHTIPRFPEFSPSIQSILRTVPEDQLELLSKSKLLMQIHDELIFEIPNHAQVIHIFQRLTKEIMGKEVMREFQIKIPLRTNISIGQNWGKMREIEAYNDHHQSQMTQPVPVPTMGATKAEGSAKTEGIFVVKEEKPSCTPILSKPLNELIVLSDDSDCKDDPNPDDGKYDPNEIHVKEESYQYHEDTMEEEF